MLTEKGTLPIGIEYAGEVHQEFEVRPQLVRDTVDIFEDKDMAARAKENNQFFAACLFARRLVKIGTIPKGDITVDMILDMDQDDYSEIIIAGERLEKRRGTFRGGSETVAQTSAGPD